MTISIDLPDDLLADVERQRAELGLSRPESVERALCLWLDKARRNAELSDQIDRYLVEHGDPSDPAAVEGGRQTLLRLGRTDPYPSSEGGS